MSTRKQLLFCLLAGVLLFGVFSWPLYRHFSDGIPYTSRRTEDLPVRQMVMGDHLQLLYHFWLPAEWLAGNTRFGYDLYQFNLGDDDDRAFPRTDYMPFSGLFALLFFVFSRATSWNTVSVVAIWFAIFFMWRLLQLYELKRWPAFCLALTVTAFPYQWSTLFGGSPTGFAMMTVPMLFYGIELAVRQGNWRGGLLAAGAILSAFYTDTHVLLFSYMLGPLWVVLALIHDGQAPWKTWKARIDRAIALSPLLFMALLTMFLRLRTKQRFDEESVVGGGWSWDVVGIFSPSPRGLYVWQSMRHDYHIYLGFLVMTLLVAGFCIGFISTLRSKRWNRALHLLLLAGGLVVMIAFGLGTNGPRNGMVLQLARQYIPPITMMRQTAKIFAMFAPIMALLLLPIWSGLSSKPAQARLRTVLPAVLGLIILLDWFWQVRPGISLLNETQGAVAAIAADADEPRAVIVPIWPGDSAWASLYMHDVSLHRLRMINGYSPVVSRDYIENVFVPLITLSSGVLTDAQIEFLNSMGVHHLLLYQDAFPEQISWFPIGVTLQRFLFHPRLELMKQDRTVWAFRILEEPREVEGTPPWTIFGSRFQADFSYERPPVGGEILEDSHAGFGRFMRLTEPQSEFIFRWVDQHETVDPRFMVRARGQGEWQVVIQQCDEETVTDMATTTTTWTWFDIPMTWSPDCDTWQGGVRLVSGEVDFDMVSFISGTPPDVQPGESYLIPAPTFYHAGYTDLERDAVILRPRYEPAGRIFYGPRWVLPDGRYQAELVWATPPPDGVHVGRFEVRLGPDRVEASVDVDGSTHEPLIFSTQDINLPLEFGLHYARQTEIALRGIRVTRLE